MKVLWAILALTVSGCSSMGTDLFGPPLPTTIAAADLHWPPAVWSDAQGKVFHREGAQPHPTEPEFVQQLLPDQGSDPTVVATRGGTLLVSAFEYVHASNDFGRSWVTVLDVTGDLHPVREDARGSEGSILAADPETDRVWVSHRNQFLAYYAETADLDQTRCALLYWTDDAGRSWQSSPTASHPASCALPFGELVAQRMFVGPRLAADVDPLGYPKRLYYCGTSERLVPKCEVSRDGGETFMQAGYVPSDAACTVVNFGSPAAAPDGTVYLPVGTWQSPWEGLLAPCSQFLSPSVFVSHDGGITWRLASFPDMERVQEEVVPDVAVTPDGTAYLAFRTTNQIMLARSRDHFMTWDEPVRVSVQELSLTARATVLAGDNGRVLVAYLGTRTPQDVGAAPRWAAPGTQWHLFVSQSDNADGDHPTFRTTQVTPEGDPVQVGCIDARPDSSSYGPAISDAGPSCRNLLNFIDATLTSDGRAVVAFVDGCELRNDCAGDVHSGFQARERRVAVAVQDRGDSLIASKGPLSALGLTHPRFAGGALMET